MAIFILLLVRRIGLAIGAFVFFYFMLALTDAREIEFSKHIGMATGAAIVAFFIPSIKIGSHRRDPNP